MDSHATDDTPAGVPVAASMPPRRPLARGSAGSHAAAGSCLAAILVLFASLALPARARAGSGDDEPPETVELFRRDAASPTWSVDAKSLRRLYGASSISVHWDQPDRPHRTLELEAKGTPGPGRRVFRGGVAGIPGSSAILATAQGAVAGSVFIPGDGMFSITPASNGGHQIDALPPDRRLPCGVTAALASRYYQAAAAPNGRARPLDAGTAPSPGTVVLDLLVVHTPAALAGAGGLAPLTAQVDAAVADLNDVFANSQVPVEVRLVGIQPVDYLESGETEEDLALLTEAFEHAGTGPGGSDLDDDNDSDKDWAALKPVPGLRRAARADLVCLVVETAAENAGIANQLWRAEPDFAPHALSVIQRSFLNRYHLLAHEIGHNLGAQHDRSPWTEHGVSPYSFGYRFAVGNAWYRTVMALGPGLTIPHFSNPAVRFLDHPTGISADQPDSADNARTIAEVAPIAAQFDEFLDHPPPPAPRVHLEGLVAGQTFALPAVVPLEAEVDQYRSPIRLVEFFAGQTPIGAVETPPYRLAWTNTVAGQVDLWVRVTTTDGATGRCSGLPVRFSKAPTVELTLPASDGWALKNTLLECRASASDPDGTVVRVEFFANAYLIGVADRPPFTIAWTNIWSDEYVMTARAIDDMGVATTSAPVRLKFAPTTPAFDLTGLKPGSESGAAIRIAGQPGARGRLEWSEDAVRWTLLKVFELGNGPATMEDPGATGQARRFYRIRPERP